MKVAIYANEIAQPGETGVKTYSREIISNLLKVGAGNEFTLYSEKDIKSRVAPDGFQALPEEKRPRVNYRFKCPKKRYWIFRVFPKCVLSDRPDVILLPIQTYPFCVFRTKRPRVVVTIHDVAFLLFPEYFGFFRRQLLKLNTFFSVRLADRIIVPSEVTKRDLLRFYGIDEHKIRVVHHGYSTKLLEIAKQDDPRVTGLSAGKPYILFVGSIQPRKNIVRLVKAFELLKKNPRYAAHKLIICGRKGWLYEEIFAQIDASPAREDIIMANNAGNELLASLYAGAELFVMPSLYEGFGLPVLEAMSFGLPVICADNSSLTEISGNAALLADGYSTQDLYIKIKSVLDDSKLSTELSSRSLARCAEFSWEKAARETLEVLESVA